ncbi:hypothetical protein NONI108955_36425 [Nocardia ninae]|uniref:Minor tail protein n=1 Tax=Nocardia ninae NBRC 108245 TaxID=1210091 RepID=A0A511MG27_9NOCA|nr:hypothetical protein [Nocardia ninae]GEM39509.1 hypothetical protein NN4_40280 [Nocardia ninae NBRC 108245]
MSTVGEYFQSTVIRGIDEGVGGPGLVQSLHGTPRDGSLELTTGTPGDRGPAGEPAREFRWEGDIDGQTALDAIATKLGPAQAGKAWRVLPSGNAPDTLVYWNGTGFDTFVDAFGAAGPDGQPCTVTIGMVETGPIGSKLQATITGTPPSLTLDLTVPRGVQGRKGDPGPPGPIRQAPDYADGPHVERTVPMWDTTIGKWVPRPYPGLRGPWSIVENLAWDSGAGFSASQSNIGTTPNTVAVLNIPAQDTDWRPYITGGVMVASGDQLETRIDAEVRLGSAAGQIVALGSGWPSGVLGHNRFQPYYGARMTPESTVGVVLAGQPAALYVVLRRNSGNANYSYAQAGAQIVCWARPVGKTQ